jgi:hypothetical protein
MKVLLNTTRPRELPRPTSRNRYGSEVDMYNEIKKYKLKTNATFLVINKDGFQEINPGGLEDSILENETIIQSIENRNLCFIYNESGGEFLLTKINEIEFENKKRLYLAIQT